MYYPFLLGPNLVTMSTGRDITSKHSIYKYSDSSKSASTNEDNIIKFWMMKHAQENNNLQLTSSFPPLFLIISPTIICSYMSFILSLTVRE